MVKESALVAAHFFCLSVPDLSFELALEIVEKEFSQHGVFIYKDICIGDKPTKSDTCLGCNKYKLCYGNNILKFCAKCLLPKDIYGKYLKIAPVNFLKAENPEYISKLEQQVKLLTKK